MVSAEDRLTTWLTASAAEWRAEPDIQALLQQLADSAEAHRYLVLFRKLAELPLDELEAIVEAVTEHRDEEIDLGSRLD